MIADHSAVSIEILEGRDAYPDARPSQVMHTGRLVLTTIDPHVSPQVEPLVEALGEAGLLGEPMASRPERSYLVGSSFLALVAFTGCAVSLRTEPETEAPFSHIRIPAAHDHPRLIAGRNTRPPRCVSCRARLGDWQQRRAHWATHPHAGVTCEGCGQTRPPWLWDWKQQGGFGRLFIQIEEIFPNEATPSPALFELLIRASGTGWRHFYIQD